MPEPQMQDNGLQPQGISSLISPRETLWGGKKRELVTGLGVQKLGAWVCKQKLQGNTWSVGLQAWPLCLKAAAALQRKSHFVNFACLHKTQAGGIHWIQYNLRVSIAMQWSWEKVLPRVSFRIEANCWFGEKLTEPGSKCTQRGFSTPMTRLF